MSRSIPKYLKSKIKQLNFIFCITMASVSMSFKILKARNSVYKGRILNWKGYFLFEKQALLGLLEDIGKKIYHINIL